MYDKPGRFVNYQLMQEQVRQPKPLSEENLSEETTMAANSRQPSNLPISLDTGYTKVSWNVQLQRKSGTTLNEKEKFISRREIDYDKCRCKDYCGVACVNRKLNIECHQDNCIFYRWKDCTNRRSSHGPKQCLEVFDTESVRGFGLRATEFIKAGDFIVEYIGEILKLATNEGEKRYFTNITEGKFYMMELENNIYIDASRFGNQARFINHSCQPNCIVERWNIRDEERICIFASKNIRPGQELTYNYDFDYWPQAMECHCGAFHCIRKKNKNKMAKDPSSKKRRRFSKGSMRNIPKQNKQKESAIKKQAVTIIRNEEQVTNLKVKCSIDVPQMYADYIRVSLEKSKEEFKIIYPQGLIVQSPHKTHSLELRAENEQTLETLYNEICRLVEDLQYRIVEIDKDLKDMLSPLLEMLRTQSGGTISFGVGGERSMLKAISRIQVEKTTYDLYVVAKRTDFDHVFAYIQTELDSLVSDYFVVPLSKIGMIFERAQHVKSPHIVIKHETCDAKNLVLSIKGKRFEAIKAKAELTSEEYLNEIEQPDKTDDKPELGNQSGDTGSRLDNTIERQLLSGEEEENEEADSPVPTDKQEDSQPRESEEAYTAMKGPEVVRVDCLVQTMDVVADEGEQAGDPNAAEAQAADTKTPQALPETVLEVHPEALPQATPEAVPQAMPEAILQAEPQTAEARS